MLREYCQNYLLIPRTLPFPDVGLKVKYFQQQGWEREWVDEAKDLVLNKYIAQYEDMSNVPVPTPNAADPV